MDTTLGTKLRVAALAVLVIGAWLALPCGRAEADTFAPGDVFVALGNGAVEWHRADGSLNTVLVGLAKGHAEGMGFDASGNLYVTHWCVGMPLDPFCSTDTVEKWSPSGLLLGTFGGPYSDNPTSIVFDNAGNAYVGQADSTGDILKFSLAGTLLASYDAATETRGTSWIDLDGSGCIIYYTSWGPHVLRFNVCAGTQMSNFASLPAPSAGHALQILPDGGVLVANDQDMIVRLDAGGNVVQTYDITSEPNIWYGLDLTDDGAFWASDWVNFKVAKFDLATGAVLTSFSTTDKPKGVAVNRAPSLVSRQGRMTGGGSIFTDTNDTGVPPGTRVTHGFELHCDKNKNPNNLEINIHNVTDSQFHLETLTSAFCYDDPNISPNPPNAPFDTYVGTGTGKYNGVSGATAEWTFTDAGEPGVNDRIKRLKITDASGNVVLFVPEPGHTLTYGNHQAHK